MRIKPYHLGRVLVSLLMAAMGISGCMPLHLAQLNGKTAQGTLTRLPHSRIFLMDSNFNSFELESPTVLVSFSIERIGQSQVKIMDQNHTAIFQIPRSVLNRRRSNLFIPAGQSGQPYDLEITETSKLLKTRSIYREEDSPIYIFSCSLGVSGGTDCIPKLVGFDTDYYLDTRGETEHFLTIRLINPGVERISPVEVQSEGEIYLSAGKTEETLYSKTISAQEYSAHKKPSP